MANKKKLRTQKRIEESKVSVQEGVNIMGAANDIIDTLNNYTVNEAMKVLRVVIEVIGGGY